jgi:hypothetical protein
VKLRPDLAAVVDALVLSAGSAGEVSLDDLGEAIGVRAVTPPEIEAILATLEARGVQVRGPEGGGGEERLGRVVAAARALGGELGRRASIAEIAERAGLSDTDVRHALALACVMQR